MASLKGKSFSVMHDGVAYKFTITRDWDNSVRVIINDSIQAIWLPKKCLQIENGQIVKANIAWKLAQRQFKHKVSLITGADYPMGRLNRE